MYRRDTGDPASRVGVIVIETTGRTYAKPWTPDDLVIWYGRPRFKLQLLIMLQGDKRYADLMMALTADAPSPTVAGPTEESPAPGR